MDALRYFAPEALLPASAADLAALTGRRVDECEPYLYLNMLNALADARFPAEAIPRYVRGLYGLESQDFSQLVASVDTAIRNASDSWESEAETVIRDLLDESGVDLLGISVVFQAFLLGVELELSIAPVTDRAGVVGMVEGVRDVVVELAHAGELRPIGASIVSVSVWTSHPVLGWTNALRVAIDGATAVEYEQRDARGWLRAAEASLHPILADHLVRGLKAKLAALRGLNRGLDAVNRFLRKR